MPRGWSSLVVVSSTVSSVRIVSAKAEMRFLKTGCMFAYGGCCAGVWIDK